jgi:hypothetical protein
MPGLGSFIQTAIREGSYTAGNVPTVAAHLVGGVKSTAALAPKTVTLNAGLMGKIEAFLEQAGVPVQKGLSMLKSDAAADAIVLTAKGLEGTGKEVAIKLTNRPGIFADMPHIKGNMLHLNEELMAPGVHGAFTSVQNGSSLLVRIEPLMEPVDKVIAAMPAADKQAAMQGFTEGMRTRIRAKGLADIDLKANNFAIPRGSPPVTSVEDLLSRPVKIIDTDAVRIRTPEVMAQMAEPVHYKPVFHDAPPQHIDQLFAAPELPALESAQAVPATQQAVQGKTGNIKT